MTNAELVQYFADGYKLTEIKTQTNLPLTTINKKIYTLKKMTGYTHMPHIVAEYFRKGLIK